MKPTVVDSSVTVKWINQIDDGLVEQADQLLSAAQAGLITLIAPELSKYEIGNALLNKGLRLAQAYESVSTVYQLPITFVSETEALAKETYAIAQQTRMTYYDACFVALAKQEHGVLVTDNAKHQGKTTEVTVIPLADYSRK